MEIDQWLGEIDYPMYIVTAAAAGERSGCLVGFATQCSIDPLRFVVCLSDKNRTYRVAGDAATVGVHLVPADGEHLARLFGSETGDEVDKFAQCDWYDGLGGVPILADCPNWFIGLVLDRVTLGDHTGYVLEPIESGAGGSGSQFDFHRAKHFDAGHDA